MLRNRIISGVLAAAMLIVAAACDKGNTDNTAKAADTETSAAADTETKTAGAADADNTDAKTDDSDDTNAADANTGANAALTPIPSTDDILFKYAYHNRAWGYQSRIVLITCSGDVYVFEDNVGSLGMNNGDQIKLRYLKEYAEPTAHIDPFDMTELYNACLAVDPGVKTDRVSAMEDAGECKFIYVDQDTSLEITIVEKGDYELKTDDPALLKAQGLAETLIQRISYSGAAQKLFLQTEFINAPYGGTELIGTHIVFDDYNEMIAFCRDNGIGIDLNEDTRTTWKDAKYMLLRVFDTNQIADGVLITDGKVLQILPSLAEFEYDPAYDGKVCAAIWRFDGFEEGVYVDENGDPWELYG
jgi:hypothetical protein